MRQVIKNTAAFQKLNPRIQNIIGKYRNIQSIQHDIAVIKNIGYEEWQRISDTSQTNLNIINEIIKKEET